MGKIREKLNGSLPYWAALVVLGAMGWIAKTWATDRIAQVDHLSVEISDMAKEMRSLTEEVHTQRIIDSLGRDMLLREIQHSNSHSDRRSP